MAIISSTRGLIKSDLGEVIKFLFYLLCSATQRYVRFSFHIVFDLIMFFSSSHTHIKRFSITNNVATFYRAKSKPKTLWSVIKKIKG